MTENDGGLARSQLVDWNPDSHWPYAADAALRRLDPKLTEQHAIRILARSLRTQRLVAFVGAGASMAYGRLTWSSLMDKLYGQLISDPGEAGQSFRSVCKTLWKGRQENFRTVADQPLKAQIMADHLAQLRDGAASVQPEAGKSQRTRTGDTERDLGSLTDGRQAQQRAIFELHRRTSELLIDHHGFLEGIAERLENLQDKGSRSRQEPDQSASQVLGFSAVVRALIEHAAGTGVADLAKLLRTIDQALSLQPLDARSPLRQLILDWGVRRFITTNYDREIERALSDFGFRPEAGGSSQESRSHYTRGPHVTTQSPHMRSLTFNRHGTGEALGFAVDGSRRHAEVLHIHGDVHQPESLIITESDYQQLYLAEHPTRDLVNNATLANFAANPVLFVGSDVNEDDVLRPIRQFMTGPGHRSDRLAVAVFAGTRSADQRAWQAAQLLLKYRVHAVHAVSAKVRVSSRDGHPARDEDRANWLADVASLERQFRQLEESFEHWCQLSDKEPNKRSRAERELCRLVEDFNESWERAACDHVVEIEGQDVSDPEHPLAIVDLKDLRILAPGQSLSFNPQLGHRSLAVSGFEANPWDPRRLKLNRVLLEQWLNHAISHIVCAKLMSLREAANQIHEREGRLPAVFRKPVGVDFGWMEGELAIELVSRHRVCLAPKPVIGRFGSLASAEIGRARDAESWDEGLSALMRAIAGERGGRFAKSSRRRLIVVCAARGAGKGGQFDRLIPSLEFGPIRSSALGSLVGALSPVRRTIWCLVFHFNLSFSDEVAGMVRHFCDVVNTRWQREDLVQQSLAPTKDLLETLERTLASLLHGPKGHRVLLVLGNAGVLFDGHGKAKNGLIQRILTMFQSPQLAAAALDIVMYVGETQIPSELRRGSPLAAGPDQLTAQARSRHQHGEMADHRPRRRLDRLNIAQDFADSAGVMIHALTKTRAADLARAYFPGFQASLDADVDRWMRDLYLETGASRFAQTLVFGLLDGAAPAEVRRTISDIINKLRAAAGHSAVEATIEIVIDQWSQRFLGSEVPLADSLFPTNRSSDAGFDETWRRVIGGLTQKGDETQARLRAFWKLALELMWHLSAFSHPVEIATLAACPRIEEAGNEVLAVFSSRPVPGEPYGIASLRAMLAVVLECLSHWCLVFRLGSCHVPDPIQTLLTKRRVNRYRYAMHRHIQRYFLKLVGGRNVETTQWDMFSTTLYMSQPDELPTLRRDAHVALTAVVHKLTGYPSPDGPFASDERGTREDRVLRMLEEADRIRAAYFLLRSIYSIGIVTRLDYEEPVGNRGFGQIEQYRRTVRWVIHATQYWRDKYAESMPQYWSRLEISKEPVFGQEMGIFYPGELVWLYNECGVISLAQGKLPDAELMLSQAEIVVRALETDDTGSLQIRIRLHTALVHFERGRPHLARRVLEPISSRLGGHDVPPLLAKYGLGMIAHVGGDYDQASRLYREALEGLLRIKRSRAAAFVLVRLADLSLRMRNREDPQSAYREVEQAISLAQQGGHEDLRHLAVLALVRLRIQASDFAGPSLFEPLNSAQRYATDMDIPRLACEVHELRARLLYKQGENVLSAAEATRSLEIAGLYDLKLLKARGMLTLAKIYHRRGDLAGAASLVARGKEIATSADYYTCVRGFSQLQLDLDRAMAFVPAGPGPTVGRSAALS